MTAIVTDAHYRMSVSLIRDLFDRGVRVAACEKASIEAPVGFASRGAAQCVRLPDEEYEAALLALCREVLEIEGEKPVLLPVGAKTLAMVSRSRDAFSAVAGLCACSYVDHYYGLAVSYPAGTISQAADLASLNGQLSAGKHRLENSVIFEHCIYSFQ